MCSMALNLTLPYRKINSTRSRRRDLSTLPSLGPHVTDVELGSPKFSCEDVGPLFHFT